MHIEISRPAVRLAAVHGIDASLHMRAAKAGHHLVRLLRYLPRIVQGHLQVLCCLRIRDDALEARGHMIDALAGSCNVRDCQPQIGCGLPIAGEVVDHRLHIIGGLHQARRHEAQVVYRRVDIGLIVQSHA